MRRAVLLAVVLLTTACDSRPHRFPLHFDRMRDQPRYDAYGRSSYFADGKTMRTPPEGTIARETPTVSGAIASGVVGGQPVREIPVAVTQPMIARGQDRYQVFCRPCHDVDGSAQSPVAMNMQLRRPPSLLDDRVRRLPIGRIYQAMAEGYGLMPSYAHQLTIEDRWAVAAYVRALELRARIPIAGLPPAVQAEARQKLAAGGSR